MEHQLKQKEREMIQDTFKTHPLLLTCYKVFTPRMAKLNGLQVTHADVFCEIAWLLDYLLNKPDTGQHHMDSLWILLVNDIRKWKPDVTDNDKRIVAGTVFMVVRATLAQHIECRYREILCDRLTNTIEHELNCVDEREQNEFLQRLSDQSSELSEWINNYEDAEEWLSNQLADAIGSRKNKDEDDFQPIGTTFTRTALLTDKLIDIIGQRLTQANKLNASPDDWCKLFSGVNQQFTITWLGSEGELRDLFKMLTDKPQYAKPKRGFQTILKSHFLDEHGHRFNNLHGAKSIDKFRPIIDDCAFLLQHLTDNMTTIMKQLIRENETALREMGYFDKVQEAKQSGLSIRNKHR
jgi:succinate dehydrogenase flavin-adding protein (antitoxin of CptAB toxin-antitoxin module)